MNQVRRLLFLLEILEGRRQVILYEKGVDLGKVPGTPFHLEKQLERTAPKRSLAYKLETHRKIIACMVQDMKNRGIDPLEYFESHPDQTEMILNLPLPRAMALLQEYTENLELYGQIKPPKPGEQNASEKLALKRKPQSRAQASKSNVISQAKPKANDDSVEADSDPKGVASK